MFNNNLLMGAAAATSGTSLVSVGNSALFINANNESLSRGSMSGTATTWTASCWVYRTEPALGATAANFVFTIATDSGLSFGDGTTADVVSWDSGSYTSTSTVFRDTGWYHLVVKSVAGSGTVFVNGNIVLSGLTVNGADATMSVGAYNAASNWFDGYISEFVFIDGTALNPTSFAEYDSTGLFWTPKSSSNIKELTFGTNGFYLSNATDLSSGMTTFIDSGPTGHTITTGGNTTHSPLGHKVQNSVIYVDGTTDYISVAPSGHSDFTFGTGDWCIEGWFLRKALSGTGNISYIFDFRYASNDDDRPYAYIDGSNDIQWGMDNSGNKITSSSSISLNTWFNLAIARSSGTTTMYLNGSSVGSWSDSTDYAVGRPWFFEYPQSNAYCLNGYATELRISKGAARYTGNFTPSTTAFASDSSTSLLVHSNKDFGVANDDTGDGNNLVNNNTVTKSTHTPTHLEPLFSSISLPNKLGTQAYSTGNTVFTYTGNGVNMLRVAPALTLPVPADSGKWYMEAKWSDIALKYGGLIAVNTNKTQWGGGSSSWDMQPSYDPAGSTTIESAGIQAAQDLDIYIRGGSTTSDTGVNWDDDNDRMVICIDTDNRKLYCGIWDNSGSTTVWYAADGGNDGNPNTGSNESYLFPAGTLAYYINVGLTSNAESTAKSVTLYTKEGDWAGTQPTGAKEINSTNIASNTTRTASDTNKYFQSIVYEGNGTGQRVGDFQPFGDTFTVANSAVFNGTDMSLSRNQTTGTSAGTVWTFSAWIKRCEDKNTVFANWSDESAQGQLGFNASGQFYLYSGATVRGLTTPVWTNMSEWFHYHVAYDTGASGTDKVKLTINGNLVTAWATDNRSTASAFEGVGVDGEPIIIGNNASGSGDAISLNGYMAQVVFLDGTASAASNFGKTDTTTNRWVPKDLSSFSFGSGNNTFFLDFADSGNLGDDESGNTNDYTNNNSVTQSSDSPTINYSILDDAYKYSGYSNGNLTMSGYNSSSSNVSTIGVSSGKWYCELTCGSTVGSPMLGVVPFDQKNSSQYPGQSTNGIGWDGGTVYRNNATLISSYGSAFSNNQVNAIMLDLDNNQVTFRQADTAKATIDLNTPKGTTYYFYFRNGGASSANNATVNFGASAFTYSIPTDYAKLAQDNITASDQYISAFSWIKNRDATDNYMMFDRVRGVYNNIHSNTDDVQVTNTNTLKSFLAGGAQIGEDVEVNTASESYVLWNWMMEATGSGTSNEDGTINTAATLVDTTLGLSISQYEGTGSNATVGHGLGVAPEVILVKEIVGGASNWQVYNASLGNTKVLYLNLVNAAATDSAFQDTTPTSSVFSIGTGGDINGSGNTYIAYCFAPSQFIAMGSYEGNANANGAFTPLTNSLGIPIKPVWAIFKNADNGTSGSAWSQEDTSRSPTNVMDKVLSPDQTLAEGNWGDMDFVTGGIKQRGTNYVVNDNTIIYMAIGTPIIDTDGRIIAGR